nr:MerR family transcriptional regulator [uncultured Blautia sp.]
MYTMKQACKKAGMTYETLKFYCNEGLVPNVKRDKNNYRLFDDADIKWIQNLTCLKKCGMSIRDMKLYLQLCSQGDFTLTQRKEILVRQRACLLAQIQDLNEHMSFINWKLDLYDQLLAKTDVPQTCMTESADSPQKREKGAVL